MASFTRAELRDILGEAYTDDIGTKLVNLHQLILLRHAQGKWRDAAVLCQALLRQ